MLHVLGVGEGRRGRFDKARAALRAAAGIGEDLGLRYMVQWAKRRWASWSWRPAIPRPRAALRERTCSTEMGLNGSLAETVPLPTPCCAQGRLDEATEMLERC